MGTEAAIFFNTSADVLSGVYLQMLCLLFRLQLLMLMWDKKEAEKVAVEASDVLTQLKQSTSSASAGHVALLQLHFMVLQVSEHTAH